MGRSGDLALIGQHVQKRLNLSRVHASRMPHFTASPMSPNIKVYPVEASLLSVEAIVKVSNPLPQLVQKTCGAQNRRTGFHAFYGCDFIQHIDQNLGSKPLSGGSRDQNIPHRPLYPAGSAGYITLGTMPW